MKISIYLKIILSAVVILGMAIFLFFPNLTSASYQGCCSYHGGIDYCDSSVGRLVCNDGTYSPTCTCPKSAPTYIPTPKPTPTPPVCTINGINYYSRNECNLEQHKEGIRMLYSSLLGRNASTDEVIFWASNESDIKKIEEQIKQSDEYKQKHPSLSPTISLAPISGSTTDSDSGLNWLWWLLIGGGLVALGSWVYKQTKSK